MYSSLSTSRCHTSRTYRHLWHVTYSNKAAWVGPSRLVWVGLWAAWCGGGSQPAAGVGGYLKDYPVPTQTILWFSFCTSTHPFLSVTSEVSVPMRKSWNNNVCVCPVESKAFFLANTFLLWSPKQRIFLKTKRHPDDLFWEQFYTWEASGWVTNCINITLERLKQRESYAMFV